MKIVNQKSMSCLKWNNKKLRISKIQIKIKLSQKKYNLISYNLLNLSHLSGYSCGLLIQLIDKILKKHPKIKTMKAIKMTS